MIGSRVAVETRTSDVGALFQAVHDAAAPYGRVVAVHLSREHEPGTPIMLRLCEARRIGTELVELGWDVLACRSDEERIRIGLVSVERKDPTGLPTLATNHSALDGLCHLELGLSGEVSTLVVPELATTHLGERHAVLGTPDMIRLMERCAARALAPHLRRGWATVGVHVDVEHGAPAAVGSTVRVTAILTGIRRRRLQWDVAAHHEGTSIGVGTHENHLVLRPRNA